jgi:hypothetical protein
VSQLDLFPQPRGPWRTQTPEELDAMAVQLAERAHREHAEGWQHRATLTAWNALILFASVDEIRRRQEKDRQRRLEK